MQQLTCKMVWSFSFYSLFQEYSELKGDKDKLNGRQVYAIENAKNAIKFNQ